VLISLGKTAHWHFLQTITRNCGKWVNWSIVLHGLLCIFRTGFSLAGYFVRVALFGSLCSGRFVRVASYGLLCMGCFDRVALLIVWVSTWRVIWYIAVYVRSGCFVRAASICNSIYNTSDNGVCKWNGCIDYLLYGFSPTLRGLPPYLKPLTHELQLQFWLPHLLRVGPWVVVREPRVVLNLNFAATSTRTPKPGVTNNTTTTWKFVILTTAIDSTGANYLIIGSWGLLSGWNMKNYVNKITPFR
jgi:hypothetical protein